MRGASAVFGLLACGLVLGFNAPAEAQEFKPFDEVPSTCPTCPQKGYDKITLKEGPVVLAVVVAENSMFYVLAKFGELRAVAKDLVASVERNPEADRPKGHEDQLLTKGGLVLSGKVVADDAATGYVEFATVGCANHMKVLKSMVSVIFKAGKLYYTT
jgi:hypothetical protein